MNKISNIKAIGFIIVDYAIIGISVMSFLYFDSWIIKILACFFTATRFHALLVLSHEAMHGVLFSNKKIGDILGEFLTFNMLVSYPLFKKYHLEHHRHTNTSKDPIFNAILKEKTWVSVRSKKELIYLYVKDILGINAHEHLRAYSIFLTPFNMFNPKLSSKSKVIFLLNLVIVLGSIIYSGKYELLIMILVSQSITNFIMRVRGMAEHPLSHAVSKNMEDHTYTVKAGLIEGFIFSPHKIGLHAEHHASPTTAFYNLSKVDVKPCETFDGYFFGKNTFFNFYTRVEPSEVDYQKVA